MVLRVYPFTGSHTSTRISELIESVISDFEIPSYKVHVLVRDNGPNMVKGILDTGYSGLACFLKPLQLVIHDVVHHPQRKFGDARGKLFQFNPVELVHINLRHLGHVQRQLTILAQCL